MPKERASKEQKRTKTRLSYFLASKLDEYGWSINDAADHLNVNRQSLTNIINGSLKDYPGIETMQRLAEGFNTPLIDIMQMAGIDVYRPEQDEQTHHLASMMKQIPGLLHVVEMASRLSVEERQMLVSWLVVATKDRMDEVDETEE